MTTMVNVEVRKLSEALRERDERFDELFKLSSDWYWEQDENFRFTRSIGAMGKSSLELDGDIDKTLWRLPYIADSKELWAAHKDTVQARQPFYDFTYQRAGADGKPRSISISGRPIFNAQGKFKGYRGIGKDVTERVESERALRESEERFRDLNELSSDWYWEQDENFCFTILSGGLFEKLGIDPEPFLGKPRWEQPGMLLSEEEWAAHRVVLEAHQPFDDFTYQRTGPDGTTRNINTVSISGRPIFDGQGKFKGYRGIARNITERVNADKSLRESEARFRELTELSADWYWEQDEKFRFTQMSGGMLAKAGFLPQASIGKTRREQPGIVMSEEAWASHQATLDAHEPFLDLTYKRVGEDGTARTLSISGRPIFDAQGNFTGYRGVGKDVTERIFAEERIQYLAFHDGLTTLPNRASFSQILNHGINRARRYNRGMAVLFIDLDRFKNINDTLGHDAGDALLQEVGRRLKHCVRQSDTVARLGGDEFVILLEELSEPGRVATVAGKILSAIVKPFQMLGQEFRVTASIGISIYPEDGQDEQTLMKNADIAMYHAKEQGKNNFQFHSGHMDTHSFERLALESSLRRALERNEFELHYQAKIDLTTGQMTGMEALIRWLHPDLGMVSPVQFIPIAEETGLIVPIGKWVLRTACLQNQAWQQEGLPPLSVAVNLSARQFADENLLADIASILKETGMNPAFLELEITESMIMHNADKAVQTLTKLKTLGIRVAIDDFGTGYSSLSNLKRFPIDTLKVDRSFIRDLPGDSDDKAITKAIIALGKSLNMTLIAEGVETQEQAEFLRAHACDQFQGYYFSRPVDKDKFGELMRTRVQETCA